MQYEKFRQCLVRRGNNLVFVNQSLGRAEVIEKAYGRSIDELVQDNATMYQTLKDLEWKISKDDLDNYQNTLRHYYEMVHGHKFPMRVMGNRRLKNK